MLPYFAPMSINCITSLYSLLWHFLRESRLEKWHWILELAWKPFLVVTSSCVVGGVQVCAHRRAHALLTFSSCASLSWSWGQGSLSQWSSWSSGNLGQIPASWPFILLLFPHLKKEADNATFSDLMALNEVYEKQLFAWCLAHNRHWINVSWIQTYTEKYLLPAGLDNCWTDSCPQSAKQALLIPKLDLWLPFQLHL